MTLKTKINSSAFLTERGRSATDGCDLEGVRRLVCVLGQSKPNLTVKAGSHLHLDDGDTNGTTRKFEKRQGDVVN